jgi:hypothetical protein
MDVTTPLTLVLDGDVAIFAIMIVAELGRSDAHHWYMWQGWRACS